MTLGELLAEIREHYLRTLRAALAEPSAGPRRLGEPAYRLEHGELAREGPWRLPLRLDLVVLISDGARPQRVDSEGMLGFEPIELSWTESANLRVAPFVWDYVHVRVRGCSSVPDWGLLVDWFEHWFDPEDIRPAGADGLCGVVHFLSDPQPGAADGAHEFVVDLGSASVAAVEELLDVLTRIGANRIELGE